MICRSWAAASLMAGRRLRSRPTNVQSSVRCGAHSFVAGHPQRGERLVEQGCAPRSRQAIAYTDDSRRNEAPASPSRRAWSGSTSSAGDVVGWHLGRVGRRVMRGTAARRACPVTGRLTGRCPRIVAVRPFILNPAVLALHPELPVVPSSEVGSSSYGSVFAVVEAVRSFRAVPLHGPPSVRPRLDAPHLSLRHAR